MSTAYSVYDSDRIGTLLGVQTFEKLGQDKPRLVFTWAINPAIYLWEASVHIVVDEYGHMIDRNTFVTEIVGNCEVQKYDMKAVPA